jgi:hypothetical protein
MLLLAEGKLTCRVVPVFFTLTPLLGWYLWQAVGVECQGWAGAARECQVCLHLRMPPRFAFAAKAVCS